MSGTATPAVGEGGRFHPVNHNTRRTTMTDNKRIVDVIADALEMHISNTVKENTSMNDELSEYQRSEIEDIIRALYLNTLIQT